MENTLSKETNAMIEASGDKILWDGTTKYFSLFSPIAKGAVITRWIVSIVIFIVLSVLYSVITINSGVFNVVFLIVFFIVFVIIFILPFTDRNLVMKQCHYYITEKRVISQRDGMADTILSRNGLKVNITPERDGCVSIAFGASANAKESKLFRKTFSPDSTLTTGITTGIVFLNVEYTDELKAILQK